ncbi:hypothetical protein BH11PSE14_BH11PSE14_04990 [soil metagenome]
MIRPCPRPHGTFLDRYAAAGAPADCYATEVPGTVSLQQFVEAFYTGRVFKLERLILRWFVGRPSTDAEVRQLAAGDRTDFAAWRVEKRADDQLLMCDYVGRTRSWFMVVPIATDALGAVGATGARGAAGATDAPAADGSATGASTRLYFGSAVVPVMDRRTGMARMSWPYHVLLGFHRLYSRVLLRDAAANLSRLSRQSRQPGQ